MVDLNSSCKGLTGGVVKANCGGLYDDVPCAALQGYPTSPNKMELVVSARLESMPSCPKVPSFHLEPGILEAFPPNIA